MDYRECCRTCLGSNRDMRNLSTKVKIAGDEVRFLDILQNFYNFKKEDHEAYPENICIHCAHQLTMTYSFKYLVETSAKTLAENVSYIQYYENNYDPNYESDDQKYLPKTKINESAKSKFKRKIDNRSDNNEVLFCVECKAQFDSSQSLSDHCTNMHPVKCNTGRGCDYCNEKFEDFRSLVMHRKLHIRPYLCENCWEGFYTENSYKSHTCQPRRKEKDRPNRDLRQCDQCGKSYPPGYIKIHLLTHGENRPYSCKFCPKKFKVPGGLNSHVLWNHKRTRNHKCEECNATFISASSRSSHIRKNHLKEKKYGCESCTKRFFSKSELQRHTLTHTGAKNFHCDLCDKSYQTRYGLNVHLKSHTQISNIIMNL